MSTQWSGVIAIDKPAGISSAQVVAAVKRATQARKAGHSGTLDPFATGLLLCPLNRATRLARFLLQGEKTYQAVLRLGIETDTQDLTGTVISRRPTDRITHPAITEVVNRFRGRIMQKPPIFSALKHRGQPLYKLARKGRAVQKPARQVTIKSLRISKVAMPDVQLEVTCSSGTYIRTLVADIGQALGCGSTLKALRRTAACGFQVQNAIELAAFKQLASTWATVKGHAPPWRIEMADVLADMPTIVADDQIVETIRHGRPLLISHLERQQDMVDKQTRQDRFVKVIDKANRLLAVVEADEQAAEYKYCCVVIET
jgi:tRNA pseudouridine55 synthase